VGIVNAIVWPNVFQTTTGTYVLGTKSGFKAGSDLMISRLNDGERPVGSSWSTPVRLTRGRSFHTQNTGFLIQDGYIMHGLEYVINLEAPITGWLTSHNLVCSPGKEVVVAVNSTVGIIPYSRMVCMGKGFSIGGFLP